MSMLSGQSDPSAGGLLAQRRGGRIPRGEIWRAFVRMLGLVQPHRRAMALGLFLSLGVAVAYVASLAGVIPVLKVIVEDEDLHSSLKSQAEWAAGQTGGGVKGWALRAVAPLISAAAGLIPASDGSTDAARDAKREALLIVVLALVIINLVGNTLRVLSQYLIIYASHRMVMDLRRHMYRKALRVPVASVAGNVSNTVSQFMTDIREVFLGIVTLFGKVAREPLKAICVFALALMLDARLTLILLAVAPPAVGLLWYFGRKVRKATVRLLQGYGRMLGSLEETLQGILVVKGYAREGEERRRMWGLERRMFKQQLRLAWIESLSSPLIEVIGVTLAAAGIVWLGSQAIAGEISPTHFIAMVMLLAAMLDPIRKVANVYNNVQRSAAAAHRIFGFLDWPEETSPADAKRLPNQPHEVCFDAVSFRYAPDAPLALCDVSLTVAPGECVAIVGPNGSGKSTLLKLLARFMEPESGRVLIDGIDATELSLKALREQIAIVSQQPVIFARSAAENIGYGKPAPRSDAARKTRREEVRDAARRAFAAEFIEALPEEYDTVLGEFGATLSGGERQRISIARAFLKPASIVIFDEATSEVDAESERKIHAALQQLRQGKTTFLIAHRHTVMDMAERIVVMDAGRIVDTGTHAELIDRCPLYQGLYRAEPVH